MIAIMIFHVHFLYLYAIHTFKMGAQYLLCESSHLSLWPL
jgi:hypothetical protein